MGKTIRATAGSTGRKGKHIGRSDKKFPGGTQRGATDRAAQRAKRTQTRSNLARWEEGEVLVARMKTHGNGSNVRHTNPHKAFEAWPETELEEQAVSKQLERRGAAGAFRGHRQTKVAEVMPAQKAKEKAADTQEEERLQLARAKLKAEKELALCSSHRVCKPARVSSFGEHSLAAALPELRRTRSVTAAEGE